jgi:dienelactone hydrolase
MKQRSFLPRALAALIFFLASSIAQAQTESLPKAQIIEKVVCKSDASQSYALYLPSSYAAEKKWPLLLAFDPLARGHIPVERFKEAAEKHGYIVMASNNSRNGPQGNPSAAFNAMWSDAAARFTIDDRRIYATGFSGGARVASSVGLALKGRAAGVILCGAGFHTEANLSAPVSFAVFVTIGSDDFNYSEVKELERKLSALSVSHRVEVFDGGHDWASSELCMRALEWMELQAMAAGLRDKDEKLIAELLENETEKVRAHEAAGRVYQSYIIYRNISRDFKGLKDVAEFENKAAQLKDSKEVRQAIKSEKDQEIEYTRRANELFTLRAKIEGRGGATAQEQFGATSDSSDNRMQVLSELRKALADLKKKADAKDNTLERAVARRALNQYLAWSYETAMSLIATKKYAQAIAALSIDADAMPDNWRVLYNLACAHSLNGDKKRAIDALKRAVQKGFSDRRELERNPSLDALREEAAFKKIVEELGKKQA